MPDIVALGECMVELYADEPLDTAAAFHRSLGGDTFNVLATASRLGSSCGYLTRVGDDPFGRFLLTQFQAQGVDATRVKTVAAPTGLYFISLREGGQRQFVYYRSGSAASTITPEDLDASYLQGARIVHTSGITQAISPSARRAAVAALELAHQAGVIISFDPNLRTALWTVEEARQALQEVLPFVDIVLPSAPEETELLLGLADPEEVVRYFWARGVSTVAVKLGPGGCLVGAAGKLVSLPIYDAGPPLDTTGAGDAFDGAFLHGLLQGLSAVEAARLGCVTAGLKVLRRGAVAGLPTRDQVEEAYRGWPNS